MKKRVAVVLGVAALSCGYAVSQTRADAGTARNEIQSELNRWGRTIKSIVASRDYSALRPAMERLGTNQSAVIYPDGTVIRGLNENALVFANWLREMKRCRQFDCRVTDFKLTRDDNATGKVVYTCVFDSVDPLTQKTGVISFRGAERHVWVRTEDGWRDKELKSLHEKVDVNGRPLSTRLGSARAIQAQYNRIYPDVKAMLASHDFSAVKTVLMEMMSPDFTHVGSDGTTGTRTQAIAYWTQELATWKSLDHWTTRIRKITMRGPKRAEVLTEGRLVWAATDPFGKTHRYTDVSTERHTWVFTRLGWKWKRSQPLSSKTWRDGKPFTQPMD